MDVTSKPQVVEELEEELRRLELALAAADQLPSTDLRQLQNAQEDALFRLEQIQTQWQLEQGQYNELLLLHKWSRDQQWKVNLDYLLHILILPSCLL